MPQGRINRLHIHLGACMSLYQYPQNLGNPGDQPASIQFQWYTRKVITDSVLGDTIVLYMPQEASQPSTTSWDQEAFGIAGRGIVDHARGIKGPSIGDFAEKIGYSAAITAAQMAMSKFGSSVSAESIAGASVKQLANPYLTMVFRGVDFRKFSFQFKFSPFTPNDAQVIFNIMQSFRKNSLPTHSSQNAFLGYPSECEIQYLWQGSPNNWLNRFKRSVCTKVDINYTAQGLFAAMRDGFPASVIMNVEFTELDIVTADDISYYGQQPTGGGAQSY
jgi:hypothetical protein